jgi:hypothetical protein
MELKSITLDALGASEITLQPYLFVLDTIDISKIQFTNLELRDLEKDGVLTSRTNLWKWKLN